MTRTVSSPPFPDTPGRWLALFRQRARNASRRPYSPEQLGVLLGVSGATVRRWESGSTAPTDQDIVHLSKICELSPHQTAFLRIAFSSAKPPQWPDPKTFRENTIRILTGRRAPTILFDELMYARAWNSYVGDLGEQAAALLGKEKHPIEAFFEYQDAIGADPAETMTRVRRAIRTFWRFSARYCESWEYCELIKRLRTKIGFDDAWMELASSKDQSAIDIAGVAELFLPSTGASFSIIESLVVYPPLYAIFMFVPTDEAAREQMEDLEARGDPKVIFDPVALSF